MFRKKNKKKAQPQVAQESRGMSYVIGDSMFPAGQDFYEVTFLKTKGQSNSESSSVGSASSTGTTISQEASHGAKKRSSSSLTFSTFLNTPRMVRKKRDGASVAGKDLKSNRGVSPGEEDLRSSTSQKAKENEETGKKQSVMSKVKQALGTPRLLRKSSAKNAKGSKPLLAQRSTSLTETGWGDACHAGSGYSNLHFVDIGDFSTDQDLEKQKMPAIDALPLGGKSQLHNAPQELENRSYPVGLPEGQRELQECTWNKQADDECAKTLSLDVDTAELALSGKAQEVEEEEDFEACDTLQFVDGITDEEASESLSSNSAASAKRAALQSDATDSGENQKNVRPHLKNTDEDLNYHHCNVHHQEILGTCTVQDRGNVNITQVRGMNDKPKYNLSESEARDVKDCQDHATKPGRDQQSGNGSIRSFAAEIGYKDDLSAHCSKGIHSIVSKGNTIDVCTFSILHNKEENLEDDNHENIKSEDCNSTSANSDKAGMIPDPAEESKEAKVSPGNTLRIINSSVTVEGEIICDTRGKQIICDTRGKQIICDTRGRQIICDTRGRQRGEQLPATHDFSAEARPPHSPVEKYSSKPPTPNQHCVGNVSLNNKEGDRCLVECIKSRQRVGLSNRQLSLFKAPVEESLHQVTANCESMPAKSNGSPPPEENENDLFDKIKNIKKDKPCTSHPLISRRQDDKQSDPDSFDSSGYGSKSPKKALTSNEKYNLVENRRADEDALTTHTGLATTDDSSSTFSEICLIRSVAAATSGSRVHNKVDGVPQPRRSDSSDEVLIVENSDTLQSQRSTACENSAPPEHFSKSILINRTAFNAMDDCEFARKGFASPLEGAYSRSFRDISPGKHSINDVEIAEEFLGQKLSAKDHLLESPRHRSSMPTLNHIRNLQDQFFLREPPVNASGGRPSSPLFGSGDPGMGREMRTQELFRTRASTPALGTGIGDYTDESGPVRRQGPFLAKRPLSFECYTRQAEGGLGGSALRLDSAGGSSVFAAVAEQPQAGLGRPASPVLRGKVNSALDSLISKPVGQSGLCPVIGSVGHLREQMTSTLPKVSHLHVASQDTLAFPTMGAHRRPPSPFSQFSPRSVGHKDLSDMDIEFSPLPPVVPERASDILINDAIPPLNLDFIKNRSEDEAFRRIEQSPCWPSSQKHLELLRNNFVPETNFTLNNYTRSLTENLDVRHTFPGYRTAERSRKRSKRAQLPDQDGASDVSSVGVTLSDRGSSDSDDVTRAPMPRELLWQWKRKSLENWNPQDVVDWCDANGFHQAAYALKEHGVTGRDLMTLPEEYLGRRDAQSDADHLFVSELHKLRLKPKSAASLWRLKQTSMKRRTLEASSEVLRERLSSLQQESSAQDHRIDQSIGQLAKHQQDVQELLSPSQACREPRSPYPGVSDSAVRTNVPLLQWTTDDVLTWLRASSLENLAPTFQAHGVQGLHLAAISLQLLDDLGIHSIADRELLLSKLYDLQRTTLDEIGLIRKASFRKKLEEKMVSPHKHGERQKSETIRITHELSGTTRCTDVKLHEGTTAEDVVRDLLEELEVTDDKNLFSLYVTAPHIAAGEGELGRFECPLSATRQSPAATTLVELRKRRGTTVKVMCKMLGIKPRGKVFRVAPFSTGPEFLQVALHKFKLSHVDSAVFCLLPINKDNGDVRLMGEAEVVQDCETDAFVLSHQENAEEFLHTAEHALTLLEQNKQILRRSSSLNSHGSSALSQSSETSQGSEGGKPRNDQLESLEARMADIETSLSSTLREEEGNALTQHVVSAPHVTLPATDAVPCTPRAHASRYVTPRKQQLPSSQSYVPEQFAPDDQLELLREIALMKESIQERDSAIALLRQQNQMLHAQSEQVGHLNARLTELSIRQEGHSLQARLTAQAHSDAQCDAHAHGDAQALVPPRPQSSAGNLHRVRAHDDDSDSGWETNRSAQDGNAAGVSGNVEQLRWELRGAETEARTLEGELAALRMRQHHAAQEARLTGNTINVQLLAEDASISEAKLLQVKQRHANLYGRLELTRRDGAPPHSAQPPCLYDALSPGPAHRLLAVRLACPTGPGFVSGRDRYNRVTVTRVAAGLPLIQGDRLLEVNGQRVFHMDDEELQHTLQQCGTTARLVVVRDALDSPGVSTDADIASKEDLSLAILEVESTQQENQDLSREVEKLKTSNGRLEDENGVLREELRAFRMQQDVPASGAAVQSSRLTNGMTTVDDKE